MNFGLLIAAGDPLSGYYLNAFLTKNLTPSIIIIDEKEYSKRDHEIHKERTGNQLPSLDLNKITENIKVYSVDNHNSKKCIEIIDQHKVGILINAGTPRIIKEALLKVGWETHLVEIVINEIHTPNQELINVMNYIKEARAQGGADSEIKRILLTAGWEEMIIDEGFEKTK